MSTLSAAVLVTFRPSPSQSTRFESCPGCSGELVPHADGSGYADCFECGGLVTCKVLVGAAAAYRYVSGYMAAEGSASAERYFDISYIEAATNTLRRRHGWYDPATGLVTQVG